MHTIKLNIRDNAYEHILYILSNLGKDKVEIVEDYLVSTTINEESEISAYSNHSANLIDEWKDTDEEEENNKNSISYLDEILNKTSGLLKARNIDPVKWQREIRNEWKET